MKLQRPQYLMAAVILFVLGIQCLYVDSYILTPEASDNLSSQLDIPPVSVDDSRTDPNSTDSESFAEDPVTIDESLPPSKGPQNHTKKRDDFSGRYTVILPEWFTWSLFGASLICFLRTIPWLVPARQ
tara:strand:- start:1831 stop:2214 length:384 start_codon:yes stop_codon:yes gene_type:complete